MKKAFTFGILPIVLGAIAAIFRARELAFGFDFASGLPNGTVNTTPMLLVLAGIMLVAVIALTFKKKPEVLDAKKHIAHTAVSLIGVAVMLALGGYVFWQNQVERDVIMNIFAVVCLLNAFAFAILGLRNLRANANGIYSFLALVPVVWSCVALILVFRERVADPIIADFVFLLFAFICILLFSYAQTGYVYRKNRILITSWGLEKVPRVRLSAD